MISCGVGVGVGGGGGGCVKYSGVGIGVCAGAMASNHGSTRTVPNHPVRSFMNSRRINKTIKPSAVLQFKQKTTQVVCESIRCEMHRDRHVCRQHNTRAKLQWEHG